MTSSSWSTRDRTRRKAVEDAAATLVKPRSDPGFAALAAGALPDRELVLDTVNRLHRVLVPETLAGGSDGAQTQSVVAHELAEIEAVLASQVRLALDFDHHLRDEPQDDRTLDERSLAIVGELVALLPELRERLFEDAEAAWRGDPSCTDPIEALYAFPGVLAVTRHRIAHVFYGHGVRLLPRLIAEHAHRLTGIDIHPGATIGRQIFIDHGTGVVIGETAVIGDRVTLYQGVTLGAKSFHMDAAGHVVKGIPRHPIIEDDVTLYANATILGRVRIGRGSVIGGNVWLTHSVPANSRVYQAEARETVYESGGGI